MAAALGLLIAACGDNETVRKRTGTVAAQVQRTLPTVQGTLLSRLCDPLDASTGQPMATRRAAQHEMNVLLRTLRESPEAAVQTLRMTHQGDIREKLTVRELAQRHLAGLPEIVQTLDGPAEACARTAADSLRKAIKQS